MLLVLIPLILLSSSAHSFNLTPIKYSAASPAQIQFALENKYDDTGPGAKKQEYAYHTYKNHDDALVAFLDDPDTKLPEHEKARAIAKLYRSPQYDFVDAAPKKPVNSYAASRPVVLPIVLSTYSKYDSDPKGPVSVVDVKTVHEARKEPFKWQKQQAVKASPLSISHYNKDVVDPFLHKLDPSLSFSYDVHNKQAGDLRYPQESKGGSAVHGYYSVVEKDGRRRTVHYEADPFRGFRSTVQRVFHN